MESRPATKGDDISSRTIVLIPARLGSTRLPGKPLAPIAGVPMIVQVWRRAHGAGVGPVVVACAEPEIAQAVQAGGGEAVLTDPDLPSGTDRIFAALCAVDPERRFDQVVNLQGDLPTLEPAAVRQVLEPLRELGTDMATLANATQDEHDRLDPNVVKAVVSFDRRRPELALLLRGEHRVRPDQGVHAVDEVPDAGARADARVVAVAAVGAEVLVGDLREGGAGHVEGRGGSGRRSGCSDDTGRGDRHDRVAQGLVHRANAPSSGGRDGPLGCA